MNAPTYILAGGRSSRFGSDKARALLRGQPLIVRLAQRVTGPVTVVAKRSYEDLGLRTIPDIHPDRGPLAGLYAALRDCHEDWLLLLSCDLLELRPQWIDRLTRCATDDVRAVAFRNDHWHPMPGLYHRDLLPGVEARLARSELALQRLLDAHAVAVPLDFPLAQANTTDDLRRFEQARERSVPSGANDH